MITIGLTGWSDHGSLTGRKKLSLEEYTAYFPFVELDTSFYAIPPAKNIDSWMDRTPENFQFIPKAYQAMTTHQDWIKFYPSEEIMFKTFVDRFAPMVEANKIKAFLFQFPPFFDCTKSNVEYLRKVRHWMGSLPVAIEFRHSSWYSEKYKDSTLDFLMKLQFIHTVVDEPPTPNNSVPAVIKGTNPELTLFRLHGRNYEGWQDASGPDWRKKRTLYNYSQAELESFKPIVTTLEQDSQEVAVIFNNNSGGHAAPNAKQLQSLLGLTFDNEPPEQLGLF